MNDILASNQLPLAIGFAILLVAGIFELKTFRVPNVLTFGAILVVLVFAGARTALGIDAPGIWAAVLGTVIGGAMLLPIRARTGLGAGCVKAQAAFGGWVCCALGIASGVIVLVVATVVGLAILQLYVSILKRKKSNPIALAHGQWPLSTGAIIAVLAISFM